jgi:hypothetical protein
MIRSRAAVAWAPGQPLEVTEIEGLFPTVLGHEGGAIVVEIGPGVTSVAVGDHVSPTGEGAPAGLRRHHRQRHRCEPGEIRHRPPARRHRLHQSPRVRRSDPAGQKHPLGDPFLCPRPA